MVLKLNVGKGGMEGVSWKHVRQEDSSCVDCGVPKRFGGKQFFVGTLMCIDIDNGTVDLRVLDKEFLRIAF